MIYALFQWEGVKFVGTPPRGGVFLLLCGRVRKIIVMKFVVIRIIAIDEREIIIVCGVIL